MSDCFGYGWVSFGYRMDPEERLNRHQKLAPQDHVFAVLIEPWLPKWLRPNHVTIFRFMLVPAVVVLMAFGMYGIAVPLFIFLGLTDSFDGSLARVRRQISEWGIVFDSVSDKALILSMALILVLQETGFWLGIPLLVVEGLVIVNAWFVLRSKRIVPANFFGKLKMVCEVAGLSALLMHKAYDGQFLLILSEAFLVTAVFSALASLIWKRNFEKK